ALNRGRGRQVERPAGQVERPAGDGQAVDRFVRNRDAAVEGDGLTVRNRDVGPGSRDRVVAPVGGRGPLAVAGPAGPAHGRGGRPTQRGRRRGGGHLGINAQDRLEVRRGKPARERAAGRQECDRITGGGRKPVY